MEFVTAADSDPPHFVGISVAAVLVALVVLLIIAAFGRNRKRIFTRLAIGIGCMVGLYLIVRGVAEFFIIDYHDPASYRDDWGGPSLLGVFAVHTGPGLVALLVAGYAIRRRLTDRAVSR
ncbi:hypothetical protein ACFWB0_06955 [Rhodococcus sp. NPDC060086]|uniref:hypothetical protein n=1 Tax=Rhodococcus sp. NPDC060086 TaxID=3347055 RepID=UPI0036578353